MPSSRSAQTASARRQTERTTRPRPAPRPRRVPLRSSVVRVRWERVGRIALLVVLVAVVGLYAEHALSYVSTREQASHARAVYVQLARQHRALEDETRALQQPSGVVQRARRLGMTRAGEQPYVDPSATAGSGSGQ